MSYTFPNANAAREAATLWTKRFAGKPVPPDRTTDPATGRTITRYIVGKYPTPDGAHVARAEDGAADFRYEYGVVMRWTYDDRPDLGEFGGGFVWHVDTITDNDA